MIKINIILTFASAFLLTACATYNPQYRNQKQNISKEDVLNEEVDHTFYLIGNARNDQGASTSMQVLGNYVSAKNTKDSYVLFLGNSFSPEGMQPKNDDLT